MNVFDIVRKSLPLHEGARDRVYFDTAGVPTIGIGRNLRDRGLSAAEIMVLFENDLSLCARDLDTFLPWWRQADPVRQAVLFELMFNLGWPKLRAFKATLACFEAAVKSGKKDAPEFGAAADNLEDSLWYRQVKSRARRLVWMVRTGEVHADIAARMRSRSVPPEPPVKYADDISF